MGAPDREQRPGQHAACQDHRPRSRHAAALPLHRRHRLQAGAAEPAHGALTLPDGSALGGAKYATTLADYRYLYRTYRATRLRTLHQQWPVIAIWDDHEFSDDCWQDHQTYTNANLSSTAATWKVWGNEVMLNRLWVDLTQMAPPPYNAVYVVNCDAWDG